MELLRANVINNCDEAVLIQTGYSCKKNNHKKTRIFEMINSILFIVNDYYILLIIEMKPFSPVTSSSTS